MAKGSFSFGAVADESTAPEFELNGVNLQGEPMGPFVFRCLPMMNEVALARVYSSIEKNEAMAIGELIDFIEQSLPDKELRKFRELVDRKDLNFKVETFAQIFQWLVEEYSGHPIQASSGTSVGPTPTAATSTDAPIGMVAPVPSGSR